MTYWLPAMTISRPKFSPADPIIVLLDPLNHNYVLSGVFLFIYDLLGFNGASSINYWYIFLFIDSNSIFFSPVSLSFDSCLHDCLQKGLLGDVIVEQNALKKSSCFERPHPGLNGEVNGLEVDQVHFPIINAQSEDKLTAKRKNSK